MFPVLVLYHSRSYASVYGIRENAHMLYWKSVDHVCTDTPSEARIQGKDKNDCLKDNLHNTGHFILELLLLDRQTGLLRQNFCFI